MCVDVIYSSFQSSRTVYNMLFPLFKGIEGDDKGLIMTLDSKLGDVIKPINVLPPPPPSRIPVVTSHQFCGLSSLSGWLLRALSYFQNAHLAIVSFTNNVSTHIHELQLERVSRSNLIFLLNILGCRWMRPFRRKLLTFCPSSCI